MGDYGVTLWTGLDVNDGAYYLSNLSGTGSADLRERTVDLAGESGVRFGREFRGSRSLTLEGTIDGDNVHDLVAAVQRAWDDPATFATAGSLVALEIRRPGRAAVLAYGRPDRFDPELEDADVNHVSYSALFRQADPNYYSATEKSVSVAVASASTTGLVLTADKSAIEEPLLTSTPQQRAGFITNDGDTSSFPVVIFTGPSSSAKVELLDDTGAVVWELALTTSIADGDTVTIDTRPWARTVLRGDGANLAGKLTRASWPSRSTIPTGRHEVVYTAQDATGSSTCEVRFRDAYLSI